MVIIILGLNPDTCQCKERLVNFNLPCPLRVALHYCLLPVYPSLYTYPSNREESPLGNAKYLCLGFSCCQLLSIAAVMTKWSSKRKPGYQLLLSVDRNMYAWVLVAAVNFLGFICCYQLFICSKMELWCHCACACIWSTLFCVYAGSCMKWVPIFAGMLINFRFGRNRALLV